MHAMKSFGLPLVIGMLLLAGCSKPGPGRSEPLPPEPKRNLSESLGFQSGEDVFAHNPPPPATPAAAAVVVRTLTGRDGRTLEALLLSRTASSVKVRRTSDRAEFTIPFTKLSDADCAFITNSALPVTPGP
jgi:hypothetical protein